MKTSLLFPLPLLALALIVTGCSDRTQTQEATDTTSPTLSERADGAVEKTKEVATDTKDAISAKLTEWNLTPSDIKTDLEKTGRVVRDKTLAAGETVGGALDNARLVTVINGKFVADSDLSARKINVDADNGVVTLTGTADSTELIGRAVALALHTDGVSQVISLLTVHSDEDTGM